MKILLLGCEGQIGNCLSDKLLKTQNTVIYSSKSDLNIADLKKTTEYILDVQPDVIINSVAYTAVDLAEKNKIDANLINNIAVKNIAKACKQINCLLVHFSSDYIFDGLSKSPYLESARTNPLSIYGKSKLDSEFSIKESSCRFLIIRTGWVYSEYGNNFLKSMLKLAQSNKELSIVSDQFGCPTYAQDIAESTIIMISMAINNEELLGIYNYCGDTCYSWYDFSLSIFTHAKDFGLEIPDIVNPISTEQFPSLASRPKYSVLNCQKASESFKIFPSNVEKGIINTIGALKSKNL